MGGASGNFNLICQELSKENDVSIFSGRDAFNEPKLQINDCINNNIFERSINLFGSYNTRKIKNYYHPEVDPYFKNFIKERKPDIVHFHVIEALGASLISFAKEMGLPVVVTMHDWWWICPRYFLVDKKWNVCSQIDNISPQRCYCMLNRKFFIKRREFLQSIIDIIDIIIIPSNYIKNSLIKNGLEESKLVVIPNGIIKEDKAIRKKPTKNINFGFVGGNDPNKGWHVLVKAFNRVKYGNSQVLLYGFGKLQGFNDKSSNRLSHVFYVLKRIFNDPCRIWQKLIIQLNNIKNLIPTKYVTFSYLPIYSLEELNNIYSNMDILIIPSVMRESFCLVAREAMYRNVPVIISDCGGPEEIVRNGINGFIFQTNNDKDLANKILQILKNPLLIQKFIKNIDKTKILSIKDQADQIKKVYYDILS